MLGNCFQLLAVAALAPALPVFSAGPDKAPVKTVVRPDSRTGRLVRSVAVPPRFIPPRAAGLAAPAPAASAPSGGLASLIEDAAQRHEVDPALVHSVIQVESNYNPFAISPKGAQGLMQLIPATARRFGVGNVFDARENIEAGVKYLKYLQDMFKDDRLALAAYNAGEGAVLKYRDIPPYPETEQYVYKVGKKYGEARSRQKPAEKAAPEPPPAPAEPPVRGLDTVVDADGRVYLKTR
jgi:soluble lytic murein transglycosylase-like protein